jgi:hypothetical protein
MSAPSVWSEFSSDPRDRAHAALRATDADRDLVRRVLSEGYAEGRLDRDELDERADAAGRARTLGDLPGLIDDLIPAAAASSNARALESIPERAVARYEKHKRDALTRFVMVSSLCWAIWLAISVSRGELTFAWPIFVMIGTGFHFGNIAFHREEIIAQETRRLEKKERKALAIEQVQQRFLGPGQPYWQQHGRGHGRRGRSWD